MFNLRPKTIFLKLDETRSLKKFQRPTQNQINRDQSITTKYILMVQKISFAPAYATVLHIFLFHLHLCVIFLIILLHLK